MIRISYHGRRGVDPEAEGLLRFSVKEIKVFGVKIQAHVTSLREFLVAFADDFHPGAIGGLHDYFVFQPQGFTQKDLPGDLAGCWGNQAEGLGANPGIDPGNPFQLIIVPPIPVMALMQIISWDDRYPERPKDAEDLLFLMDHYAEAGIEERLYGEEEKVLLSEGFDAVMAGIRLPGRDMAAIASDSTGKAVASILENEIREQYQYRLCGI